MPTDRQVEESAAGFGPRERLSDAVDPAAPSTEGEAAAGARPSITHLPSSQNEDEKLVVDAAIKRTYDLMLLDKDDFSGPIISSSHSLPSSLSAKAVVAIDWLEEGGIIAWDDGRPEQDYLRLEELQNRAREEGQEQEYELAGQTVMVFPLGMGQGRQERLPIRLGFPGVVIGLSRRPKNSRQHPNFYLKVTGEACVIYGALAVRKLVHEMIAVLGVACSPFLDPAVMRVSTALGRRGETRCRSAGSGIVRSRSSRSCGTRTPCSTVARTWPRCCRLWR